MGNRNSCGLFDGDRRHDDFNLIHGLTDDENKTLKDLYKSMDISGKI
jgi:hypothetical protein